MRVNKHVVVFEKERYSSYEVERMLLNFGSHLTERLQKNIEVQVTFKHQGMYSKKQDYIN